MAKARKLPSGSWRCLVFSHYETTADGKKKRIYESFTSTDPTLKGKKECERMAAEWAFTRNDRVINITIRDAIKGYIDVKESVLSPSTINGYRGLLRTAYGSLADLILRDITDRDIQVWVSDFSRKHSPKTVRNAFGLLSSAMVYYKHDRPDVTLPAKVSVIRSSPEDNEVQQFIKWADRNNDKDLLHAILLSGFCSLRRSEVCALYSEDITENGIYVHRAMVRDQDGYYVIVDRNKTTESTRFVQAPDFLLDMLKDIDGKIIKCNPDQLSGRYNRARARCKKKYGFDFRFHDLRHYYASVAHALGIPDQYIMEMGGWKTDNVMKRVYRNTMSSKKKEETKILEDHFKDLVDLKG